MSINLCLAFPFSCLVIIFVLFLSIVCLTIHYLICISSCAVSRISACSTPFRTSQDTLFFALVLSCFAYQRIISCCSLFLLLCRCPFSFLKKTVPPSRRTNERRRETVEKKRQNGGRAGKKREDREEE